LQGADEGQRAQEHLLSVKQVAEQLGVTTATAYALCADGRLAHVRILNVIRIAPSDLAAFVASCHHPARPRS
jgi:excisionase family DNA binding protein